MAFLKEESRKGRKIIKVHTRKQKKRVKTHCSYKCIKKLKTSSHVLSNILGKKNKNLLKTATKMQLC